MGSAQQARNTYAFVFVTSRLNFWHAILTNCMSGTLGRSGALIAPVLMSASALLFHLSLFQYLVNDNLSGANVSGLLFEHFSK